MKKKDDIISELCLYETLLQNRRNELFKLPDHKNKEVVALVNTINELDAKIEILKWVLE